MSVLTPVLAEEPTLLADEQPTLYSLAHTTLRELREVRNLLQREPNALDMQEQRATIAHLVRETERAYEDELGSLRESYQALLAAFEDQEEDLACLRLQVAEQCETIERRNEMLMQLRRWLYRGCRNLPRSQRRRRWLEDGLSLLP